MALHVLYVIDSLRRGGAESSLAAMAPGLVQAGTRLDVVTLRSRPGLQEQVRDAGATVTELEGSRNTWWYGVANLARERRPDLVHTTLFEADLAGRIGGRLAGVPVVSTLANDAYGPDHRAEYPDRRVRLLGAQLADATTARLTTRLHAVSWQIADTMSRRLLHPRKRIHVIPRGRDPRRLGRRSPERRAAARAGLGIAPDAPLVLAVARQERQKSLSSLIDALPLLVDAFPDARVVVAGAPGNDTEVLEARHRQSPHARALTFLGGREDVPELLSAADVFVLPSRREGLPGSMLEAMALECPTVVSDIPQTREVADESMAVFSPPGDGAALGRAIVATLADPAAARTRARLAYARFDEHFTIDGVVRRMVDFYRGAVATHQG